MDLRGVDPNADPMDCLCTFDADWLVFDLGLVLSAHFIGASFRSLKFLAEKCRNTKFIRGCCSAADVLPAFMAE